MQIAESYEPPSHLQRASNSQYGISTGIGWDVQVFKIGLGLWQDRFEEIEENWLRWYDINGNWIPTDAESTQKQLEQERQRAEQERQRAEQLLECLRAAGINPDEVL